VLVSNFLTLVDSPLACGGLTNASTADNCAVMALPTSTALFGASGSGAWGGACGAAGSTVLYAPDSADHAAVVADALALLRGGGDARACYNTSTLASVPCGCAVGFASRADLEVL
jgi:hypothetical protein